MVFARITSHKQTDTLEKLQTLTEVLNSQINSIKAKWSQWNIAIRLYKL